MTLTNPLIVSTPSIILLPAARGPSATVIPHDCTAHQSKEYLVKAHARVLAIGGFPILLLHLSLAQQVTWYQYVYPKPDSRYVSKETNIILRPGMELDPLSVSALLIRVEGSRSGLHRGTMVLSDDRRTVVFNLQESLAENERVSVDVAAGLRG